MSSKASSPFEGRVITGGIGGGIGKFDGGARSRRVEVVG
jgi:hypothetical protein